jgi:hypothetical protein
VQQPIIDYNNGHSAAKIAPQSRRLARDFNAPLYQERVAPRVVPPGYHCVSKRYTLNAYENPRYEPNPQRVQNNGYLEPNNMNQQGAQFQIDQLMNTTVSYMKPYSAWFDQVLLPSRYRLPDFIKFTGIGSTLTMEHIS